ncbi:polyribonucleotide nucleotidyltransferase [Desulfuribacillus alkaliarsenatis]|uniref:Polyribonucleotide nucleotidyltransferase n=1 Tax=Desulfuribacillus alkaliarsenatis TaxID=766136 RepID=A0A1E5G6D0_9FIRM|nr:polyribonucleotide nucleotidyltransferase [Desulfuribacillus alkaliarsenatis]OEF98655.1 polyribonucleotide nucleotidyltransferase [Desulfuribacillus alkaliarsenatis]
MEQATEKNFSIDLAGRTLTVESGKLAKQANGSVLVRYGDTAVLATVTASREPKNLDFFPLTVNYEERLYAVGKIPGGFIKREGRPSEKAILASRLIDRPIRPLFADGFRNEVQIVTYVLSADQNCSSEMAAMLGASVSLGISDVPFDGPIAGVVVGRVNDEFIINPTIEQAAMSDLDLVIAGTKHAVNMVEAGAKEISEEVMLEAILFGHEKIKELVAFQEQIIAEIGKEKMEVTLAEPDAEVSEQVKAFALEKMSVAIQTQDKHERQEKIDLVKQETVEHFTDVLEDESKLSDVKEVLDLLIKKEVRRLITEEGIRPDGRSKEEIRPITSEVGILPRTHGSGLFTRGQTQALSICTLGPLGDVQILDGLGLEESKRFMHHYNFPPFSVGEARPLRPPGRREIGHGALGERALEIVIPNEEEFPYTIRLVSEILESNGSTSQAAICASTLAMMDAGVPIKAPVAGIAMGLVMENDKVAVLSDIQGMEDFLGDMDFKVAGTRDGITALQMDMKISGITKDILVQALEQAKAGRNHILDRMLSVIDKPKSELSKYAPKIITFQVKPDKIRDIIGPGGKMINKIIEETGVKIDIEQDGKIYIATTDLESGQKAKQLIENIVREVAIGETYLGKVTRVEKYGAFVELIPNKEGLLHISQLSEDRVNKVEDVVNVGDTIMVKVTEIDAQGKVKISHKAYLKDEKNIKKQAE